MVKTTTKHMLTSILLTILLTLSTLSIPTYATNENSIKTNYVSANKESKIDSTLKTVIAQTDQEDTIKISVWLSDVDESSKQNMFYTKINEDIDSGKLSTDILSKALSLENNQPLSSSNLSVSDVQLIKNTKREAYKDLHTQRNDNFANTISENKDINIIYSSKYLPMLILETTKENIYNLAQYELVDYIYLHNDTTTSQEEEISATLKNTTNSSTDTKTTDYGVWQNITGVEAMRDAFGYRGHGIKIGILDDGWVDINHSSGSFTNSNVINLGTGVRNVHASMVAAVLVGKTSDYQGVVPEATLYCTSQHYGSYAALELLIDENVDIINISLGLGASEEEYCNYGSYARYLDSLINNYDVTVCKSAGNYGLNNVPEGAMSYNSITVGNLEDFNTMDLNDDVLSESSSYTTYQIAYKPDICAPGKRAGTCFFPIFATTDDLDGGTSSASPIVAGICAQLMEANPILIAKPMALKSILLSSAKKLPNMDISYSNQYSIPPALSRSYGAGMVHVTTADSIIDNNTWQYYNNGVTSPTTQNITISANAISRSKKLTITLTYSQPRGEFRTYNHTMQLYDPNGALVAKSAYSPDRKQVIYYEPSIVGSYTVKITKSGIADGDVSSALSYNLK